ncbi:14632_t:CDS:2, partial [Funneliformis geosporum]
SILQLNPFNDMPKSSSNDMEETKDPFPTPLLERTQAEKSFRDHYMNRITKAFGEDLDKLRKKEVNLDSNKLEILINTLESGISIFSDVEKELALLSSK